MKKLLILGLILICLLARAQENQLIVMFYNTENLFDTEDDPEKTDEGFTPEGNYHWTKARLYKKLNNLARVILASGEWDNPSIIGLCEVENRNVLQMFTQYTALKSVGYRFIHYESPDPRGIDVALLYNPDDFMPLISRPIRVKNEKGELLQTRDILYVKGLVRDIDTLHIFVNHWPSKYGSVAGSLPRRFAAALTLKQQVDSLLHQGEANILIMGDLNDNPFDISVKDVLQACIDTANCESSLINLMAPLMKTQNAGSHKFQGQWDIIDNIIVSKTLYEGKLHLRARKAKIFAPPFMLTKDKNYTGKKIYRTYNGMKYEGGYSDHLPVITFLAVKRTEI